MGDVMPDLQTTIKPATVEQSALLKPQQTTMKTAADWTRDLRLSAAVNKTTTGVDTDKVTPELLLATSKKLLGVHRKEQEVDAKDSLEFQRVYGPAEYFAEHVLKDSGKIGRTLLWRATNKGNLDFMQADALDAHISDVFYDSKLAQMSDSASPLENTDASFKVTRIGEGGVSDVTSAPDAMRTVQPSFFGYIDPVRSPESVRVGLDMYLTKNCMKGTDGKLYQKFIDAKTGKEVLLDSVTAARSIVAAPEMQEANTESVFALGGATGVRIVPKKDIQYYLPRADDAYSFASNMVAMPSAVKEMRLLMGCLHPLTSVITINKRNEVEVIEAKQMKAIDNRTPGTTEEGASVCYPVRNTIAKFPQQAKWFKKIVLKSGRTIITSYDHKWPILKNGKIELVQACKLKEKNTVLRSSFLDMPSRRTFLNGILVNKDIGTLLGYLCRGIFQSDNQKVRFKFEQQHESTIVRAFDKLQITDYNVYIKDGDKHISIADTFLVKWVRDNIKVREDDRAIPSIILSACVDVVGAFIDGYTADDTKVGIDSNEDIWILYIPNGILRDSLAYLFARLKTDTLYRDSVREEGVSLALKLADTDPSFGDMFTDTIVSVLEAPKTPIMVDIDIDDNLYAVANGIITHNSKYPLQAVSLNNRETPLVRGIDEATGRDSATMAGEYLGARFAKQGGTVSAVRRDRIDVIYDDGTKGSVALYNNFPMNAKGYIENTPVVKAGQAFKKGAVLASSNYTDDKGVSAIGTNLKSGWLSWKGGTYEDAAVISESAAKKLTSTTMYKTALDLSKTISLGRNNYVTWKPSEFTTEQLKNIDDRGMVKPGTILQKGDPMVLAVQSTEPSPGTMGKRVLTDVSEKWEHSYPGIVTDVVKSKGDVKVFATITAPAEIGDKISGLYGNKCEIAQILPDDQMPQTQKGEALEVLWSPLGLISRTNQSQIYEALLGKIAKKTGKVETIPAFYKGDLYDYVANKLKQNNVQADEDLINPETGAPIKRVLVGQTYVHKLKHLAESKMSARGTSEYTAEGLPGGKGFDGSKRFGRMEQAAMVGHKAFENMLDSKVLRGQSNTDFWRSIRTGEIPTMPGEPLIHRKFFAHLTGAGVNIRKTNRGVSCFTLSKEDVKELAGSRELKSRDTYESKTFNPIDGGLFGQDIFGLKGDKWAYIQLDEPLPNPVMEAPLASLLGMAEKDFIAVSSGKKTIDGMSSSIDIKKRLSAINLDAEAAKALESYKSVPKSKKDAALKRYRYIEQMRRADVAPDEYMLDRIPVIPPVFRPISTHDGLTMVADSNYLYAQMLDSRDDMRDATNLPDEYKQQARTNLYKHWKELTGLYEPENPKLKGKHVQGLLKWALGDSPKWSAFQRKVLGQSVDTVGRGVVVPNPRLKLNEVGVPEDMAFNIMAPFIERALVKRGYSAIDAIKQVKDKTPQAKELLLETMKHRPVMMNRAPTLHKLGIMAFNPVLTSGHAIHVNPSIVVPYNMDFDGDQVNLHVPVSENAIKEARERMFPERNLVAMKNKKIAYKPEKEYQQGLYIATRMKKGKDVRTRTFDSVEDARTAYREGLLDIDDPITIRKKLNN